jgi:hypothetical protein
MRLVSNNKETLLILGRDKYHDILYGRVNFERVCMGVTKTVIATTELIVTMKPTAYTKGY